MIRETDIDIFYYTQPVDSDNQATSLVQYLTQHGWGAHKDGSDQVIVPVEAHSRDDAAEKAATFYTLVATWKLYWQHCDQGVFELPVYIKD